MLFPPLFPQATLIGPVVLSWTKASNQTDGFQDVWMRNQTWNLCDPANISKFIVYLYQIPKKARRWASQSFQMELQGKKKLDNLTKKVFDFYCHWNVSGDFIQEHSLSLTIYCTKECTVMLGADGQGVCDTALFGIDQIPSKYRASHADTGSDAEALYLIKVADVLFVRRWQYFCWLE